MAVDHTPTILRILRNGRERHTGEILERLREDHGVRMAPQTLTSILRRTPDLVCTGRVTVPGKRSVTSCDTWKLERTDA